MHFPGVDGPAFVAPGMALGSAAAWPLQQLRCGASPHPPSPLSLLSAPPAEKAEWSVPSEPVTVTAAVTAAEERARRGGETDGRKEAPSLPAIAVRRLLLLGSHSGKTPLRSSSLIFPNAGTTAGREGDLASSVHP